MSELSLLEQVPIDVTASTLSKYLTLSDLARLIRASKTTMGLFEKPLEELRAQKFYGIVCNAEYMKVQQIIERSPYLMFSEVVLPEKQKTTALEYVLSRYDSFMWSIFQNALKNAQNMDWKKNFYHQLKYPMTHLNLKPLFKAYQNLIKTIQDSTTNKVEKQAVFLQLGLEQNKCLPMCFIRIFCDGSVSWDNPSFSKNPCTSTNNIKISIAHCKNNVTGQETTLDQDLLGKPFVIFRRKKINWVGIPPTPVEMVYHTPMIADNWENVSVEDLERDLSALQCLLRVKKTEFNLLNSKCLSEIFTDEPTYLQQFFDPALKLKGYFQVKLNSTQTKATLK